MEAPLERPSHARGGDLETYNAVRNDTRQTDNVLVSRRTATRRTGHDAPRRR